jgi:hypothetical protein
MSQGDPAERKPTGPWKVSAWWKVRSLAAAPDRVGSVGAALSHVACLEAGASRESAAALIAAPVPCSTLARRS